MNNFKSLLFIALSFLVFSCGGSDDNTTKERTDQKIGVLIASHGSHSETWRKALMSLEDSVRNQVLENKKISGIKSAFMEYNEPSIATRLKEFEKEGFSHVIIVPVLLTVSTHSYDDIPTIAGVKSNPADIEKLKKEKIEIFKGDIKISVTPLLDFPKILGDNVIRRLKKISEKPKDEACVLVAYGSEKYDNEWRQLMTDIEIKIKEQSDIDYCNFAWCGHIVRYKPKMISDSILKALDTKKKALVIPVLVAYDEMFQGEIIGGAVEMTGKENRIVYKPDAILPDIEVQKWIIEVSHEYADKVSK